MSKVFNSGKGKKATKLVQCRGVPVVYYFTLLLCVSFGFDVHVKYILETPTRVTEPSIAREFVHGIHSH